NVESKTLAVGTQPWHLSLEPYAVQAVTIDVPGVKVANVDVVPDKRAMVELSERVKDLETRDFTAPRTYDVLSNPSFERLGGVGPPAGWTLSARTATVELNTANPRDGATCAYFRNDGPI